ncbi:hypothetical protein E8E11_004317 [Didymella keratinophila]|nr:hypothetical protein E8E11_004317 [Didymella keratinophila]
MATQQGKRLPNEQYTVGWICAVECELMAARMFLEALGNVHDIFTSPNDINNYLLGDLKGHNVVVASLPAGVYGISSATRVAQDLRRSFPNVRIGLMVGIAGGAPTPKTDVRLGDVVVGIPRKGNAGVSHYDLGENVQGRKFRCTAHMDKPPQLLLEAVPQLGAELRIKNRSVTGSIDLVLQKLAHLKVEYGRPACDRLYDSKFIHKDGLCCTSNLNSETSRVVNRTQWSSRSGDSSKVFTGLIASADTLMKNALQRDRMAKDTGAICFEMEAAGLMNNYPCLVVRGICDYSDTHKNKSWQKYAALAAAAYAYELLGMITPDVVERDNELSKAVDKIMEQNAPVQSTVNDVHAMQKHDTLKCWLSPFEASDYHINALDQYSPGSGEWLTERPQFQRWQNGLQNFL